MFVVDASVTAAWCFSDELDPYPSHVLRALESDLAVVPPIWPEEVANVLLVAERRGRLATDQAAAWLKRVARLPIRVEPSGIANAFGPASELARHHKLSVYEASYLALAAREDLPLATLDADLRRGAREVGVALYLSKAED